MTTASKLAALAFVSAVTAAGATKGGSIQLTDEDKKSTAAAPVYLVGPQPTITVNNPLEISQDLGDCGGPVYQALHMQAVREAWALVTIPDRSAITLVNSIGANSFSLRIPSGPVFNAEQRLQAAEDIVQTILIRQFKAKQMATPVNVNVDTSASTNDALANATSQVASANSSTRETGRENNIATTASNSITFSNNRPETIITFTCK